MSLAALVLALGTPSGTAAEGDMRVSWWFEAEDLVILLDGPTRGWVAVGFNNRSELAGSRLVLVSVGASGSVAEEHHAEPPDHPRIRTLAVRASEEDTRTRALVALPRTGRPGTMTLEPSASCGLTLAWSQEDDFAHHSAWRRLIGVRL